MRHSFVAALAVAALLLLAGCSGVLRAKFPTEDEVRAKLQKGMTAEQVLATFGEPSGHLWVDVKLGGKVHYIAPAAARTRNSEGYAGFTVYFDRGTVWDWEIIVMNPSYEHRLLPPKAGWLLALIVSAVLGLAGYGAVRLARARRVEEEAIRTAYAANEIPTAELPPEFRFITRGTTLRTVIDRAGPYTRERQISLTNDRGATAIVGAEYELPGGGAVIVLTEQPLAPESGVRAVFYRRADAGSEF